MRIRWSPEKDAELRERRGFGFEEIVTAIEAGGLVDDVVSTSAKFPHQRMFYVLLDGYVIVVPYVADDDGVFLKTAFPDRRVQRRYFGDA